jgi:hypothetical protein
MHAWAHVQDTGTVVAFTIVHLPILDPVTQEARPSPYGMALIQLDGADTALNHFLGEGDMGKLQVGRRVRAVWREHRSGRLTDISHFEAIDNE